MEKYFGLHNHTMYSNIRLLDCINRPKDLIDKAIELGLSGIEIQKTLTDDDDKPLADVVMESVTVEEYDGSEIKWYISDYSTDDAEETDTENTSETEENTDTEIETTENTEETTEEITAEATTAEAE